MKDRKKWVRKFTKADTPRPCYCCTDTHDMTTIHLRYTRNAGMIPNIIYKYVCL